MLQFVFFLYDKIVNTKQNCVVSIFRKVFVVFVNLLLPIYFFCTQKRSANRLYYREKPKLIVSLTSFPKRIKHVWLAIECILHQTYKPDLIILWLSKEQFNRLELLPTNLLKLQKRGVKIILCDGDIRSHKKYYYVMRMFPDSNIFTIDDDLFYSPEILEKTMKLHYQYPSEIIANYGSKVEFENFEMLSYNKWTEFDIIGKPCNSAFFGSGGGTFFPPNSLFSPLAFNEKIIVKICPNADDIWLNVLSRMNGTKIVVNYPSNLIPVINWNNTTLWGINKSLNDIQLNDLKHYLRKEYGVDVEMLFRDIL